eukprot:TRINITY_DN10659_c0_g1_i1.p1 TRINITY_DN10659_c0_g1~~TRINITY_DN10659_c0_g1_i1.p1  ORF type:complete len:261 (+),score=61.55 TRINITY_DN10659_c0_g1_i1:95-877(+)
MSQDKVVVLPSGEDILLAVATDDRVRDFKQQLIKTLGRDIDKYTVQLADGAKIFADEDAPAIDIPSPITAVLREVPRVSQDGTDFDGNFKYSAGSVLAPSGGIYSAPFNAGQVLCISAEGQVELLEPEMPGKEKYFAGGVLAPSGCIYFAPCNAGRVLCINAEGQVELLEPEIPGNLKYQAGGVLAPSGCIYFAPRNAARVLCISAEGKVELLEPEMPGNFWHREVLCRRCAGTERMHLLCARQCWKGLANQCRRPSGAA